MNNLHAKKTSNGSNFGWLIRQMSIKQKSGRKTFCRRFGSSSLFVSPWPPECNFPSEMKRESHLRLNFFLMLTNPKALYNQLEKSFALLGTTVCHLGSAMCFP